MYVQLSSKVDSYKIKVQNNIYYSHNYQNNSLTLLNYDLFDYSLIYLYNFKLNVTCK